MSLNYARHYRTRNTETPQSEPIPGTVANSAGGYAFPVDDWARLDRFLILGSAEGTYYIGERKLTRENAEAVDRCIKADGARVVRRVVEISDQGRAPKNDPALFVLAMAASAGAAEHAAAMTAWEATKVNGDAPSPPPVDTHAETRAAALAALPKVARIGTHLFHFAAYAGAFRGWGRGLRKAIGRWYLEQPVERLANQLVKYGQRDGWSHRDLLRLTHPLLDKVEHFGRETPAKHAAINRLALVDWVVHPEKPEAIEAVKVASPLVMATLALREPGLSPKAAAALIRAQNVPREGVPTELLNSVEVWDALLADMPMTAMIRNLGKMTAIGLLKPLSQAVSHVVDQLGDVDALKKARVHPLQILLALKTYAQGHGDKGKLTWEPVPAVIGALDAAFYTAFQAVVPTGKRILLALDVSGSMDGSCIAGSSLTAREGSSAMALVTAATERNYHITAFTSAPGAYRYGSGRSMHARYPAGMAPVNFTPGLRLDQVVAATQQIPLGGTDCALPMLYASAKDLEVDAFVIYTDSETWAGNIHPAEALRNYRAKSGIPAKMIICAMTSNGFSIAPPDDGGCLDVIGFDAAAPAVMADFIRDRA